MEPFDTTGGSSWSPSGQVAFDPHALPAEPYENDYPVEPEPNMMLQPQELERSAEEEVAHAQPGSDGTLSCCEQTFDRPTEYK